MPIAIRRFNINKVVKEIQDHNDAIEAAKSNTGKGDSISMLDMINKTGGAAKLKPDYVSPKPIKK